MQSIGSCQLASRSCSGVCSCRTSIECAATCPGLCIRSALPAIYVTGFLARIAAPRQGTPTAGGTGTGAMGIEAMGTEGGIALAGRASSSAPASSCPSGPPGGYAGGRIPTHLSSRHPHGSMSNLHRRPSRLPSPGIVATPPKPTTRMSSRAQGAGGRCPPRRHNPHLDTPTVPWGSRTRGGLPLKGREPDGEIRDGVASPLTHVGHLALLQLRQWCSPVRGQC
jgi:hypothetical protein